MSEWIKWWRSKTAWLFIVASLVAMAGALASAKLLKYPYNLIGAIGVCLPCGAIMRSVALKLIKQKIKELEDNENHS